MTAAGNGLEGTYTDTTSTEKVNIETTKINRNNIIFSVGAIYCALDINNIYLNTILPST